MRPRNANVPRLKSWVSALLTSALKSQKTAKARTTLLVLLTSIVFAHLIVWAIPGVFTVWEWQAVDQLFRLRLQIEGPDTVSLNIAHVDIDNSSIRKLNTTFAGRDQYGEVASILSRSFAAAVGYDIIFARKGDPESDSNFVAAVLAADNVYFPVAFTLPDTSSPARWSGGNGKPYREFIERMKWRPEILGEGDPHVAGLPLLSVFDELGDVSRGIGFINVVPDRDGVFRRVPLLVKFDDAYFPSMPFRMVCDYLYVTPEKITVEFGEQVTLHDALFPDGEVRTVEIPVDEHCQILLNYPGAWGTFYHFSFAKFLEDAQDPDSLDRLRDLLDGSLVIVSEVATGAADIGTTPYETDFPLSGLHSSLMNTILTQDFLREMNPTVEWLTEIALLLIIGLMSLGLRPLKFSVASVAIIVVYVVFFALAFLLYNTVVTFMAPSVAMILAVASVLAYRYFTEEQEKIFFRTTFENYFSQEVLKKIMEHPELLSLGGEKKNLTILFSDISGFTQWSASQSPEEIKRTLNEYFEEMAKIVFRYDGTIDKYIGDGMMVFFGDPLEREDHAFAAVSAAIEMQRSTRALKERWMQEGRLPIRIRVGINTGEVVVGNMGSVKRMDYTVLGANVNLAQRLEANAPVEGILISESVYQLVKDQVRAKARGGIQVKGLTRDVEVFEVVVDQEH